MFLTARPSCLPGKDQFQFGIRKRFTGDVAVKHRHADDCFTINDRHGHLGAQQFKFFLRFEVQAGFLARTAQDAAEPG